MAIPGKSSKASLATALQADGDSTDPQGLRAADEELEVGPDLSDKTQIMQVAPEPAPAMFKLVVLAGPKAGTEFTVERDQFTIGRATENEISIPDVSVSRKHVRFTRVGQTFEVEDLKSGNGTKLNGVPSSKGTIKHGDEVTIGDTVVQLLDFTAPLPERLKPINTLQSPSGTSGAPQVTTEVLSAKVLPSAPKEKPQAEKTPPPPEKPKAPPPPPPKQEAPKAEVAKPAATKPAVSPVKPAKPAKAAAGNNRMRLYGAIAVVMLVVFAAAAVMKKQGGPSANTGDPNDELPKEILAARDLVVKSHDWVAAASMLDPLKGSKDPAVQRWLDAVPKEVSWQRMYNGAKLSLEQRDFLQAQDAASRIPEDADVYPLAQELIASVEERITSTVAEARQAFQGGDRDRALQLVNKVLGAAPDNAEALALKSELDKPVRVASNEPQAKKELPKKVEPAPPPPPPKQESLPWAGPWLTEYLSNHLKDSIRLAEAAPDPEINNHFAGLVREFSQNYQQGMEAASAKRTLEAVAPLQKAVKIDAQIMAKRSGQMGEDKPGREVRKQLGNIEYLLSLDAKGDDQLVMKTKHVRNALDADPSNELAQKALKQCYDRADAMYMEAYIQRTQEPEKAKKQFKIVVSVLPPESEHRQRATGFLQQLEGRRD